MARLKVICQVCSEVIAEVDPFSLHLPLLGGMFMSPDPVHGIPPPFEGSDAIEYEQMTCPWGRTHRPMMEPDKLLTNAGVLWIKPGELRLLRPDGYSEQAQVMSEAAAERMVRDSLGIPAPVVIPDPEPAVNEFELPEVLPEEFRPDKRARTPEEEEERAKGTLDAINQVAGADPFARKGKRRG